MDPFVAQPALERTAPFDAYGDHLGSPSRRTSGAYDPGDWPDLDLPYRNPAPAAWAALPPGTPYRCKSAYLGRALPGRGGGTITGCATPSRSHPREGQLIVGDPASSRPRTIRRTVVKTRLRDARKAPCDRVRDPATSAMDLGAWLAAKSAGERDGTWIPQAPDYDFPHRAGQGKGCFYSPAWSELATFLWDRREEGVEGRALAKAVRKHPKYKVWRQLEADALEEWSERVRSRRVRGESATREAARRRADAVRQGVDVTGAEYLDTLTRGTRARKRKSKSTRSGSRRTR